MNKIEPLKDNISSVELVQSVGTDKSVVNSARVSFGGDNNAELDSKDIKLIKYLLKHNHMSPFEHNSLTFKIVTPLFVARQWMRHRIGVSYNEISGRYVEVEDRVYTPIDFRQQAKSNRQASIEANSNLDQYKAHSIWEEAYKKSKETYDELLRLGVTREQARGILPQAMFTEFYFTCNLRSLIHFINLRDHEGAQWEIQQYAKAMYQLAQPIFPETFAALEEIENAKEQEKELAAKYAAIVNEINLNFDLGLDLV